MEKHALAARHTFEFYDGTTCEMTLAFILLKKLASKNKKAYDACQKVMTNGPKDEFDMLDVLYAGYLCANMDADNILTEDEFIEMCGCDRFAVSDAFNAMTNPKKRKASADHSN
jgi:hypothetical protein